MFRNGFGPLFASCLLLTVWGHSPAADIDYELRAGATRTDNVRRVNTGEQDQTITLAGLNLEWTEESARFEGGLTGDFEYTNYSDDAFQSENFVTANLETTYKFAPDSFHWVINDRYGKLRRDPFAVDTPENRENTNAFTTGPDAFFRLGSRTRVEISGRYTDNWYELSDSDSNSLGGSLSLVRAISSNRSISLNATADRVEFDNLMVNSSYDRQSAYLQLSSSISRGNLSVSLGVNELHDRGRTFSGTLANVNLDRRISPASTFILNFSRRFSDAGDIFQRFDNLQSSEGNGRDIVPVSDPFENTRFTIGYTYERNRTTLSVNGYLSEDEYQTLATLDSRRIGGNVGASITFGSGWNLEGSLQLENREFDSAGRDDDYLDARLGIERQLTRLFWLSLEYAYFDRSSTESGEDYEENRYSVLLIFRPDR